MQVQVLITLNTMEGMVAASLAKIMSAASLAKAGGAASGSVLAGLSSMGECFWEGMWGDKESAGEGGHRDLLRDLWGGRGWHHLWPLSSALSSPWGSVLVLSLRRAGRRQDLEGVQRVWAPLCGAWVPLPDSRFP